MAVSVARAAALRYIVRHALEDLDARNGWCRWPDADKFPWEWADYEALVKAGLIEQNKKAAKDVLLRPTPAGWTALSTAWGKAA